MRDSFRLLLPLLALVSACGGGGPAQFRVVNESATRVYLQLPGAFWQLSRGGQRLGAGDACEICNCSDRDCAVCGLSPGMVEPLEPGGARTWGWDGRVWKSDGRLGGHVCERPALLPAGPLTLTVFHGTQLRVTPNGTWFEVPPLATSVDFHHEADVQVDVVIR